MKVKVIVAVVAVCTAAYLANAQTNTVSTDNTNPAPVTASSGTWADLEKLGGDFYGDLIEPLELDTNQIISLRAGGGINTVDHRPVVALMATVPVSTVAGIGFVGAYGNNSWYEGGADLTLGVTNTVPILGTLQEFAGDGVVYDFRTSSVANYSFSGIEKYFTLSPRAALGFGVVVANTSDVSGVDIIGGGNLTIQF
jgi:hypothetical protein